VEPAQGFAGTRGEAGCRCGLSAGATPAAGEGGRVALALASAAPEWRGLHAVAKLKKGRVRRRDALVLLLFLIDIDHLLVEAPRIVLPTSYAQTAMMFAWCLNDTFLRMASSRSNNPAASDPSLLDGCKGQG
jgi:hypothetical protein